MIDDAPSRRMSRRDATGGGGDGLLDFTILQAVARPAGDAPAFPRLVVVLQAPRGTRSRSSNSADRKWSATGLTGDNSSARRPSRRCRYSRWWRVSSRSRACRVGEVAGPRSVSTDGDHDLQTRLFGGGKKAVGARPVGRTIGVCRPADLATEPTHAHAGKGGGADINLVVVVEETAFTKDGHVLNLSELPRLGHPCDRAEELAACHHAPAPGRTSRKRLGQGQTLHLQLHRPADR